jgi:hypothetical protein
LCTTKVFEKQKRLYPGKHRNRCENHHGRMPSSISTSAH